MGTETWVKSFPLLGRATPAALLLARVAGRQLWSPRLVLVGTILPDAIDKPLALITKMASVTHGLRARREDFVLVHTGPHYDANLSYRVDLRATSLHA